MSVTALAAAGLVLTGIPTWHDGDSGRFGPQRVRLSAMDAGELPGSPRCTRERPPWSCSPAARAWAAPARDRLRALTVRGVRCVGLETDPYERVVVTCRLPDGRDPAAVLVREGTDPYERVLVTCRLPDGRDPAAVLVREGLARPDLRHGGDRYRADELAARLARRGVWR